MTAILTPHYLIASALETELSVENTCDGADAIIARLEKNGWAIVPRDPTNEMCDAATRATSGYLKIQARGVELRRLKHAIRWRAMIKAATG